MGSCWKTGIKPVILFSNTSALTFACFERRLKQAAALLQMEVLS